MSLDRHGQAIVFRAGPGEWYNQPHDRRWDMGEDVQELPPTAWQLELESGLAACDAPTTGLVIDTTQMDWLVGQDWGYLLRLAKRLQVDGIALAVVAGERPLRVWKILDQDHVFRCTSSVEEALRILES